MLEPKFTCPKCNEEKSGADFGKRGRIRNKRCRACCAAAVRKTYATSVDYRKSSRDRHARSSLENHVYIYQYLKYHPCVDCGESDPLALEFDHVNPADKRECVMALVSCSRTRIDAEIALCVVRCANCHTRKTAKERNSIRFQLSLNTSTLTPPPLDRPRPKRVKLGCSMAGSIGADKRWGKRLNRPVILCPVCHLKFTVNYKQFHRHKAGLEVYCSTKCSNQSRVGKILTAKQKFKSVEKSCRQTGDTRVLLRM